MLKAALKLKDALVLRCGGMELQSGRDDKGEWLKATYYDEDGTSTSERFRLQTPAQRKAFEMLFLRPHQRAPGVPFAWHTAADAGATAGAAPSGFRGGAQTRAVLAGARESVRLSRPFPPRQSIGLSQLSPTWAGFRCPAGGFPLNAARFTWACPALKRVSELATWVACSRVNFLLREKQCSLSM